MYSIDSGATFTAVRGIDYCEAVGFGKAATGADYPTIFTYSEIDGSKGIWRSVDKGISWTSINDDKHEYGGLANGEFVVGDMNVFGRVYMSTAGRGIAYGEPLGSLVPVSGVTIESEQSVVNIGSTLQLKSVVTPANASNQSVTWNSGNDSIATVNSNGLITGISEGTVTITITTTDGGFKANKLITVTNEEVTQFALLTSVSGSGNIELEPPGGVYDSADVVQATAVASSGYHFASWSGDVSSQTASINITMDANKSITAVFEPDGTGEPCDNPVSINIPFSQDGVGENCFVTSTEIAYVNSWNMETLEINGVDYTNKWSNELPPAIDGQWFIYYKGNYSWSHFEAPATKSAPPISVTNLSESVALYPNPFNTTINLSLKNPELIHSIEITDNLGRTVYKLDKDAIANNMVIGEGLPKGTYYLSLKTEEVNTTFIINKY
jgi:hypothetical protein